MLLFRGEVGASYVVGWIVIVFNEEAGELCSPEERTVPLLLLSRIPLQPSIETQSAAPLLQPPCVVVPRSIGMPQCTPIHSLHGTTKDLFCVPLIIYIGTSCDSLLLRASSGSSSSGTGGGHEINAVAPLAIL